MWADSSLGTALSKFTLGEVYRYFTYLPRVLNLFVLHASVNNLKTQFDSWLLRFPLFLGEKAEA